jgi:hypothetical protein
VHLEDAAPGRHERRPRMWRRLEGTLVYDSREQAQVGVRAVKAGFPRLVYAAPGFEIDLQVRSSPTVGRLRLLGQVQDDNFEPCLGWVVVEAAHGLVKVGLDDHGHFSIDGLTSGIHQIEVGLSEALIVIPPVRL